jgi:hypothetical protein
LGIYDAAVQRWPKARIRLCQAARVVEDSGDPALNSAAPSPSLALRLPRR